MNIDVSDKSTVSTFRA